MKDSKTLADLMRNMRVLIELISTKLTLRVITIKQSVREGIEIGWMIGIIEPLNYPAFIQQNTMTLCKRRMDKTLKGDSNQLTKFSLIKTFSISIESNSIHMLISARMETSIMDLVVWGACFKLVTTLGLLQNKSKVLFLSTKWAKLITFWIILTHYIDYYFSK